MSGHLYILTDGVNTKIGITTDLDKRLSSYKTHNPNFRQFKVYACEIDEAKRVETIIKQAFKDKLSSSSKEWFSVNPEVIDRYVSVLLIQPTQDNITPAMHGVRLTEEGRGLISKILKALKDKGG
jgi:predicted GIY-YIG superfamily endonuclease